MAICVIQVIRLLRMRVATKGPCFHMTYSTSSPFVGVCNAQNRSLPWGVRWKSHGRGVTGGGGTTHPWGLPHCFRMEKRLFADGQSRVFLFYRKFWLNNVFPIVPGGSGGGGGGYAWGFPLSIHNLENREGIFCHDDSRPYGAQQQTLLLILLGCESRLRHKSVCVGLRATAACRIIA